MIKYTREEAIQAFCKEYISIHGLCIPERTVRFLVENKLVETRDAFYMRDTHLKLYKAGV